MPLCIIISAFSFEYPKKMAETFTTPYFNFASIEHSLGVMVSWMAVWFGFRFFLVTVLLGYT
jgi:hypothetical protein